MDVQKWSQSKGMLSGIFCGTDLQGLSRCEGQGEVDKSERWMTTYVCTHAFVFMCVGNLGDDG